jgi:hypothetical protein
LQNTRISAVDFSQPFFLILEGYMPGGRTGEFEVRQHSPVYNFAGIPVCSARENKSSLASNKEEINVFIVFR